MGNEIDNTIDFTGLVSRGKEPINIRYRPRTFHEFIGNTSTKTALAEWMKRGENRSRSLMFTGEPGDGKTTMARILAAGLNCECGDTVNPCCECPSCKDAMSKQALHIKEYNMSELSKKDDADGILKEVWNTIPTGRNTVIILDEIQGMSNSSQNLLLKMLEEPPEDTYFILATTDPQKILKTVRSRCNLYQFKNPTPNEVAQLLGSVVDKEMPSMSKEMRVQIFNACKTGWGFRDILNKLDKFIMGGGVDKIEDAFQQENVEIAKAIIAGNYGAVLKQIEKAGDDFEIEDARRTARSWLCNQIKFSMDRGKADEAKKMLAAFRVFDKGFYTDPNPLPSFMADLFEACLITGGNN